jgi:DNA-binding transcriptional ArsR family regulator
LPPPCVPVTARTTPRETEVFRALADPTRRAIFERLTLGESAVKDLTARFHVSQPAISQHLAALRRAGLVSERREGRHAYYRVEPAGLRPLVSWIEQYQAFWLDRLSRLKALLEEMDE